MSLYKGKTRIASGGIDYTLEDDLSSRSVAFIDDGNYDSYENFEELQAEITSRSKFNKLFALIKRGFNFLYNLLTDLSTQVENNYNTLNTTKAPTSHASSSTTYGQGNTSKFGHVKVSDDYTSSAGAASAGVAASSQAVYNTYNNLNKNKVAYISNSNGYSTLADFVDATSNAFYGNCGFIKMKDVSNLFGFGANTWLRIIFTYQNSHGSTNGSEGMLIISKGATAKLAFISGTSASGYTVTWGNFS